MSQAVPCWGSAKPENRQGYASFPQNTCWQSHFPDTILGGYWSKSENPTGHKFSNSLDNLANYKRRNSSGTKTLPNYCPVPKKRWNEEWLFPHCAISEWLECPSLLKKQKPSQPLPAKEAVPYYSFQLKKQLPLYKRAGAHPFPLGKRASCVSLLRLRTGGNPICPFRLHSSFASFLGFFKFPVNTKSKNLIF